MNCLNFAFCKVYSHKFTKIYFTKFFPYMHFSVYTICTHICGHSVIAFALLFFMRTGLLSMQIFIYYFFFKWAPIPGLIYNNTLINIQKTKVNCLYLPINLLIEILIVNITYIWENTENIQIEGKNFMAFIQQVPITIGV